MANRLLTRISIGLNVKIKGIKNITTLSLHQLSACVILIVKLVLLACFPHKLIQVLGIFF